MLHSRANGCRASLRRGSLIEQDERSPGRWNTHFQTLVLGTLPLAELGVLGDRVNVLGRSSELEVKSYPTDCLRDDDLGVTVSAQRICQDQVCLEIPLGDFVRSDLPGKGSTKSIIQSLRRRNEKADSTEGDVISYEMMVVCKNMFTL